MWPVISVSLAKGGVEKVRSWGDSRVPRAW